MPKELEHDEIAQRFLDSRSLNFDAMGKFVGELGPELLVRDKGLHGVAFGRFNILACMLTASDLVALVGDLRVANRVAEAMQVEGRIGR